MTKGPCDFEVFANNFFKALEGALQHFADLYGLDLDPDVKECIINHLRELFGGNRMRVRHQFEHLRGNLPKNGFFNVCDYAAKYCANLFAEKVMQIALQEATTDPPKVLCAHALMAIRDTDGWGWGDVF